MTNFTQKQIDKKFAIVIIAGVFFIALFSTLIFGDFAEYCLPISFPKIVKPEPAPEIKDIKKFASEEEFKDYLAKGAAEPGYSGLTMDGGLKTAMPQVWLGMEGIGGGGEALERVSETNVQVTGVDEPDIVKTDGKEIYFSPSLIYHYWEVPMTTEKMIAPPYPYQEPKVNVISAFPPNELAIDAKIDKTGDLLLSKNVLAVFSGNKIYGYNVSNPKSPEKKWEVILENNNYLVGARLYKDRIYLVSKTTINEYNPCPIKPLSINGSSLTIACTDIYHPIVPVPIDSTFIAMVLNPETGQVEKNISFVGSSNSSLIYMSGDAIFATYTYYESMTKFYFNFLKEKAKDLVPSSVINRLEKLDSYDISESAKMTELGMIFQKYINSLSSDERLKLENELENRMSNYYKDHSRDLEKTGIVKIAVDGFSIAATGNVPGHPLNQFSLDEYNNNLRIATTIGEGWFGGLSIGNIRQSANDVYVLDENLKLQGSVKDMGLTERIYSVRFIENKGYVVTFRQTDPFYVLDLSDPEKPELKGELKIPGYSSYLHPITKDKILGIGQENWQVKISLFDVSSPSNPSEKDKYILNEGWTDVSNTHHAFLLDSKHQIFFLPGSQGGYIFSYANDKLELKRAVSNISAKRAIYINDYLYIIGDDKIAVLNEINWEKVEELQF